MAKFQASHNDVTTRIMEEINLQRNSAAALRLAILTILTEYDLTPHKAAASKEHGACRTGDKATSVAAAASVRVGSQHHKILRVLRDTPGSLTAQELSRLTGIKLSSASTRMTALEMNKLVLTGGTRTIEGHPCTLYAITSAGVLHLEGME